MAKIQFDFDSVKNRIIKNLASMSSWASFLDYGTMDNVIASLANEMAYEVQYSEYNCFENYWNLARNRSSLLQMSPMHGYLVPRKQASSGTLRISTSSTFNDSHDKNIEIAKFFQFSGNGIYVCADNDYILNANENYTDINCMQGEVKSLSFLAEGIQYEEKTIIDDSVDNSFFVLTVNGIEWKCVDSLFLYTNTDKVYQIRTLPDLSGITIRFGNDVFGKKLSKNDQIEFKYISTLGSNGNVFSADIINTVESQAFDSSGNAIKLYCTNTTKFVGGVDYPSIEYIREVSPKVYQTGGRASSRDDYYTILRQINYLSKIAVWGAYETLKDNNKNPWDFIPSEENVVHIAVLDSAYDEINNTQKNSIVETIHNLCDPTDLISFENVGKIPMIFHIDGTIANSSYTTAEVEASIKASLSETYGIENMEFGENVYDSDYVRLIDEVKGIDNHISYIELVKNDITLSSAYYCNFQLPIYPIDWEHTMIYVKDITADEPKWEELAICDSNGNLVGVNEYVTTDSSLGINDGQGKLIIKSGLTGNYANYIFKVSYRYIEENLKVPKRSDILYYEDSEINLNYK